MSRPANPITCPYLWTGSPSLMGVTANLWPILIAAAVRTVAPSDRRSVPAGGGRGGGGGVVGGGGGGGGSRRGWAGGRRRCCRRDGGGRRNPRAVRRTSRRVLVRGVAAGSGTVSLVETAAGGNRR